MTTKVTAAVRKCTSTVKRKPQKRDKSQDLVEMHSKHSVPKRRGRQVGSKNRKTLVAMAVRDGLEQQLLERGQEILQVVMDQAIDGCRASQKMMLDRLMPAAKAEDINAKSQAQNQFHITIGRLEDSNQVKKVRGEVIDAD